MWTCKEPLFGKSPRHIRLAVCAACARPCHNQNNTSLVSSDPFLNQNNTSLVSSDPFLTPFRCDHRCDRRPWPASRHTSSILGERARPRVQGPAPSPATFPPGKVAAKRHGIRTDRRGRRSAHARRARPPGQSRPRANHWRLPCLRRFVGNRTTQNRTSRLTRRCSASHKM
jgi:hypothetical protein